MKTILAIVSLLFSFVSFSGVLDGLGLDSAVSKEETSFTCVPAPPPKPPAQMSGGEGVPPLPLPAVPQRRSEKKNPPRPPTLIAKIATQKQSDWATNPADADNLLKWMAKNLNINFSSINLPQEQIPASASQVPLLYRTGHDGFSFSDDTRTRMREYILQGGTVIFDACCGRKDFFESAYKEATALVPERPPYRLTIDHPVFHSFFDVDDIKYREWAKKAGAIEGDPSCLGIDIGCRTAVFIFRWDVSCGWDELPDSPKHHCLGYDIETSKKVGANLMAYITSERSSAMPLSKALNFIDENKVKSGKFVIAQVKYNGQWKTREAGLSMLLNSFYEQTKTPVRFETDEISLESPRLFDVPFIYLTGHQNFEFTVSERANLKQYLLRGGVLLAEACCGRETFDVAFRREINKTIGSELDRIQTDSPLYLFPNNVQSISPSPALLNRMKTTGKIQPNLFGYQINGTFSIIYSPNGICCGWELAQCPYCKGYQNSDSLALGVNILSYVITQ